LEATAEEPVAAEEPIEEITVTGSTIRRKDLVTPAPVVILDKVDLDAAARRASVTFSRTWYPRATHQRPVQQRRDG
jgi:hypothetical protein